MLKVRLKLITDIMVEHVNNQIKELEIKIRKERYKEMKMTKEQYIKDLELKIRDLDNEIKELKKAIKEFLLEVIELYHLL